MSKKTNKTEHVLNILTKSKSIENENLDTKANILNIQEAENPTFQKPIEIEIKEQLLNTLAANSSPKVSEDVKPHIEKSKLAVEPLQEKIELSIEDMAPIAENVIHSSSNPEQANATLLLDETFNDDFCIDTFLQSTTNIALLATFECLKKHINNISTCTSNECFNKILIIALNSLPCKYITTDDISIQDATKNYLTEYSTEILVALTKASMQLNNSYNN